VFNTLLVLVVLYHYLSSYPERLSPKPKGIELISIHFNSNKIKDIKRLLDIQRVLIIYLPDFTILLFHKSYLFVP